VPTPDHHRLQTLTGAMLALTFTTGIVDAVGFLGLDRIFAGNMTGNVVILGMGIAGADELPVLGPGIALGAFMVGAAIGGRVLRNATPGTEWTGRYTVLLAIVALLLALTAIPLAGGDHLSVPTQSGVAAMLAIAMGLQASAARRIAVKDVTTVVVTSTLTGLAADSWFGGRVADHPWRRRIASVVAIAAGAVLGALLLRVHAGWGVGLAALLTLAVAATTPALLGHFSRRSADLSRT
jgi:uncharacterized membrane protein YoaK (UPF0700 family)